MTDRPSEPTAHGVRIVGQPGDATITIDGDTLPRGRVIGYTLEHDVAKSLPLLILHVREPAEVTWNGFARVAIAAPADIGQAVADFVLGLDPAAVQRAALERTDLSGGKHEITEAVLKQIADWAQGRS
ncbi:hypothetical protein [Streptomyces ardesiacus]|uniref:hypothetical protein n=1 Tax=Streptomyces ardesiacus TaxID=285564 RepID=UPI003F4A29AF